MSHVGLKSNYYDRFTLNQLFRVLNEGDLLEFNRDVYNHWAICVKVDGKNTKVVHRCASCSAMQSVFGSYSTNKYHGVGSIVEELLTDVLEENKVRINNSYDLQETATVLSSKVIVKRAYMYVGNEDEVGEFDLVNNNCEHFAKLCRNDVKNSEQVENFIAVVKGIALIGLAAYQVGSRIKSLKEEQKKK